MARKIEQLLRVMGDLHRFSEGDRATDARGSDELFEDDLEFIAAAASAPIDWDTFKDKNPDKIR